jgi:1,2-diacylglycerol 3-alpha-glucosyltransferase
MKIAIWSDTFPPQVNGVASVAHDLAGALTELGNDVAVFTVTGEQRTEKTPGGRMFAVEKIPSLSMPKSMYAGDEYAFALMPSPKTIYALKKFKPDIIHAHTPFLAGWGAVLGKKMFHVPLIGTHHTFYDDYLRHVKLDYSWGRKFSWKYMIAYYNRSDAVTTPTRALGDALAEHGLTVPLCVIPNPANTEFFSAVPGTGLKNRLKKKYGVGRHAIVYMGRTSYEKDIDQAIRAFCVALHHIPDATFMIVGDGPEKKKLEGLAKALGCGKKVIFTGMLRGEELRDALWANDVFLTASRSENMPISIIEAMSCGLPVVAVRAKGIPEIVRHGENGLLTAPDRPDLLARAVVRLFSSPQGLRKASAASRKLADQYSKKNIARSMVSLYETVIEADIKNKHADITNDILTDEFI